MIVDSNVVLFDIKALVLPRSSPISRPFCAYSPYRVSLAFGYFFFSSRRRHTRFKCDWSSDVCSSDLEGSRDSARQSIPELFVRRRPGVLDHPLMGKILGEAYPGEALETCLDCCPAKRDRKSVV